MNKIALIGLLTLVSCGGSLSDEQRKRLHDGMEKQKIVKISDAEIVSAAMEQGRAFYKAIEKISFDQTKVDSIARVYNVKVVQLDINAANAKEMEKQLLDAYISAAATGTLPDNIQKIYKENETEYDSLVYSKPIVEIKDEVENVTGVWNIYLSKKEVIIRATKE